ncbi:MAG: hypothetical protein WD981_02730 [Gaiellaceae bacterium]
MKNPIILGISVAVVFGALVAFGRGGERAESASYDNPNVQPRSTFTLAKATGFSEFDVFSAGESVGGIPLVAVLRRHDTQNPSAFPANYVSFIYGECEVESDTGCAPPAEVQTWPACVRHRALYDTPWAPTPEHATVRGAPAAFFEGGRRLEIYTGASTVVLFARTRADVLLVAASLRGVNLGVDPSDPLPQPEAGALAGQLRCED